MIRFLSSLCAFVIISQCVFAMEKQERPNVLLIMADDMGFSDLGCYGSEIQTPNLDRLASEGLRFSQFYNTSRCCSTRAALLTGISSHAAGVGHMVENRIAPGYIGHLNDRCVTIAEVLGASDYSTYMSGKWHVGEKRPHWPVDRGFGNSFALISGASNYFRVDQGRTLARDDQSITTDDGWYITDAITDNAVKYLKGHDRQKPFFMYVTYTAPHWPLHAHENDIAKYRDTYKIGWDEVRKRRHAKQIEMGLIDRNWTITDRDEKVPAWKDEPNQEDYAHRMAVYAAQIDRLDQGIGKIIEQLKSQKQLENTLIFFLADNGGCAEIIDRGTKGVPAGSAESFQSYGVGWANASNTPFRTYKHWSHEGGISSPLIVHWPAGLKKHGITHEPGHLNDVMATCVEVSGAKYPTTFKDREITPLAGKSLKPVMDGGQRDEKHVIYWEHEGNRAVRQGAWKLVAKNKAPWELYDLAADRTETNDLAKKMPDKVAALTEMWDKWAKANHVLPWNEVQAAKKPAGKQN